MKLLLDTHIWLWSRLSPDRLRPRVRRQLEQARNEVWLSPISVWELLMLAERGRVRLEPEACAWVAAALESAPLQQAALNHEVVIRSREVAIPRNDPADRFITATALTYDLTLVTADETLIAAKPCPILANR